MKYFDFSLKRNVKFILFVVFIQTALFSQNISGQHNEHPDQTTRFTRSSTNFKTSIPFSFNNDKIWVAQVNVDENGMNILGDAANEPSIAFDFKNPDRIAIGWRQFDNITNNFRQAGYGYTTDGGQTWTFPNVIEPGVFRSDPVLDSDSEGNFYYNSLTIENNDYVCDVYKSTDGGATWDEGVDAYGGDKQWMTIDRTKNPSNGNIYAYWNASYSSCGSNSFTRSVDKGATFEECSHIPGEPYWGTLTVDKFGDVYLCGYNRNNFVVIKSTTAKYADSTVTFNDPIVVDVDGDLPGFGGPNPQGITGQMYIASDTSSGPYGGSIYLLATAQLYISNDPADIMVVRSGDGGKTWESPVRVNDDETDNKYQWFGTLSVAPNGRVDVVWLDTRNSPGGEYLSELYYSFSVDGGQTWYPNVNLLEESFDPHVGWPNQNKMGDYFDMVSDNGGVHLAWAATFNGEQDVYYARIFTDIINDVEKSSDLPADFTLKQNYPNPFNPMTNIIYTVPANSGDNISLRVYDTLGKQVAVLFSETKPAGTYEITFDASTLSSGIYFYSLETGNSIQTKKMMLIK